MTEKSKLGSILVKSKLISQKDIERALVEQKRNNVRFGQALINLGIIQNEDVTWGLSNQLDIPFIRLYDAEVDPDAVSLVPEPLARRHNLLPFLKIVDELTIVIEDPLNQRAIAEVTAVSGCKVNICVGLPEEISEKIDEVYGTSVAKGQDISEVESDLFSEKELDKIASDFSGETFLRILLDHAITNYASSIHFEPMDGRIHIRFRIESGIQKVGNISEGWFLVLSNRIRSLLDNMETRNNFLEGFLIHFYNKLKCVFYTSIVGTHQGSSVTMLNLTPKDFPDSFDGLPLSKQDQEAVLQIIGGRSGMAVIVGRGKIEKLKFLYLLLEKKHATQKRTFVIGSMPWFTDSGYIQLKVQVEDRQDLLEGLKVAQAQDPDIVYVEDVWDQRVLQYSLQLAISNTFAMTTLHFPDTLTTLEYVNENINNKTLLTLALRGFIGIHVFHLLCPDCKEVDDKYASQSRTLKLPRSEVEKYTIYKAKGCDKCHQRGYKDSKILVETLVIDQELSELLKEGFKFSIIKDKVLEKGHRTIIQKSCELVLSGQIGIDDFKNVERR